MEAPGAAVGELDRDGMSVPCATRTMAFEITFLVTEAVVSNAEDDVLVVGCSHSV